MARILVVDDWHVHLQVVMDMLTDAGHEVKGAESQEEALQRAGSGFDLFIVDIMLREDAAQMPDIDTTGGIKVIKALRENSDTQHIPIIALTKRGDKAPVLEMLEPYNVEGYIELPSPEREIVQTVSTALDTSPAAS